mmetsp:Transcript_24927/g.62331  ORF Transcript_24927/g.62331 Transcript_24927/m.62331 type:complete len:211 (-) Transcript_24927:205-837(-)
MRTELPRASTEVDEVALHWVAFAAELSLSWVRNGVSLFEGVTNLADWAEGEAARARRWAAEPQWQKTIAESIGGIHHLALGAPPDSSRIYMFQRGQVAADLAMPVPVASGGLFTTAFVVEIVGRRRLSMDERGTAYGPNTYVPQIRQSVVVVQGLQPMRRDTFAASGVSSPGRGRVALQCALWANLPRPGADFTVAVFPKVSRIEGGGFT